MPILPKQTIVSNINSEILDNSRMLISPYDVRHNLIDMIDSTYLFLEGKNINTANFSTPDTRTTIAGDGALDKLYLPEYVSIDNTAIGYYSLHNNLYVFLIRILFVFFQVRLQDVFFPYGV